MRIKKIKQVEVATSTRGKKKQKGKKVVDEPIVDEYEPMDPNDFRIVEELQLNANPVTTVSYRDDEAQLLVGSSNGTITTVKIDSKALQNQLTARPGDAPEKAEAIVIVEWQSNFHNGPILAMGAMR